MNKKSQTIKENQTDLYYNILKECVENSMIPKHEISKKFGLSEYDSIYADLKRFKYIEFESDNEYMINLTQEGFTAYLTIGSQKQSARHAKKAIYFAVWALGVSIASFMASILFSIIS